MAYITVPEGAPGIRGLLAYGASTTLDRCQTNHRGYGCQRSILAHRYACAMGCNFNYDTYNIMKNRFCQRKTA